MDTTELLGIFRDEVSDAVAPYLWSDALIYGYIDDAQKQFCRDTFGIEDARSFTVTTVPTEQWYAVDSKILQILSATNSQGRRIPVYTREEAYKYGARFDGSAGNLQCFVKGLEKGFLRAFPVPNVAATYELQTRRLPATVDSGDEFEIDEMHVRNLLLWVKHRAYGKQDSETKDESKAARYEAEFSDYCIASKREQGRLTRNVAVVRYCGP